MIIIPCLYSQNIRESVLSGSLFLSLVFKNVAIKKIKDFYDIYSEVLASDAIIKVDPGWYQIVEEMLAACKVYQDVNLVEYDLEPLYFKKIACKHGWLDVEYVGGDEVIQHIVSYSLRISFKTCEICGDIGNLYCSDKYMKWSDKRTLCVKHAISLSFYKMT